MESRMHTHRVQDFGYDIVEWPGAVDPQLPILQDKSLKPNPRQEVC